MKNRECFRRFLVKAKIFWISVISLSVIVYFAVFRHLTAWKAEDMRSVAGTFASIAGTLLGFVIAALSILVAVVNRSLVVRLKKTGHYDSLLSELYYTAGLLLLTTVSSMITIFLQSGWMIHWMAASTAFMTAAVMCFVESGRKFSLVMRYLK